MIVNIDEVLFSNKTKWNYSWTAKGKTTNSKNIMFSGSKSVIAAITSTGEWFRANLTNKNNSEIFISFMKKLLMWIQLDLKFNLDQTIIFLDNWKIHKSIQTVEFLSKLNAKVMYVPPYTPEMCPIELIFHLLKTRLCKQVKNFDLKLNSKSTEREIREVF